MLREAAAELIANRLRARATLGPCRKLFLDRS
jgi:hypothetical protein